MARKEALLRLHQRLTAQRDDSAEEADERGVDGIGFGVWDGVTLGMWRTTPRSGL